MCESIQILFMNASQFQDGTPDGIQVQAIVLLLQAIIMHQVIVTVKVFLLLDSLA